MRNWVSNHVIPLCSVCYKLIFSLFIGAISLSGCAGGKVTKEQKLVSQYQHAIGCSNYGRLRPAAGNHEAVLKACEEVLKDKFGGAERVTAFVYRSLNRGILFVHLVYRQEPNWPREGYNFLVNSDKVEVLGGYRCGPG